LSLEQFAREHIDRLLTAAGWWISDANKVNIHAAHGVAIREFPLKSGFGFADYLLYIDGKAAGVIEAKKAGVTLSGVETQSDKYTQGLPEELPRWSNPLLFAYQSTGSETRFTNGLVPSPRSYLIIRISHIWVIGTHWDFRVNMTQERRNMTTHYFLAGC
jgi:type I restriction enzyme R subunit